MGFKHMDLARPKQIVGFPQLWSFLWFAA